MNDCCIVVFAALYTHGHFSVPLNSSRRPPAYQQVLRCHVSSSISTMDTFLCPSSFPDVEPYHQWVVHCVSSTIWTFTLSCVPLSLHTSRNTMNDCCIVVSRNTMNDCCIVVFAALYTHGHFSVPLNSSRRPPAYQQVLRCHVSSSIWTMVTFLCLMFSRRWTLPSMCSALC